MAERLAGGSGDFEGEKNVRGFKEDGSYNWFDMYPKQEGETNEAYGKRMTEMQAHTEMAEKEGKEREDAAAAAEKAKADAEYAMTPMGRQEASIRERKDAEGNPMYTPEQADQMVAALKAKQEEQARYEATTDINNASEEDKQRFEEVTGEKVGEAAATEGDAGAAEEKPAEAEEGEPTREELTERLVRVLQVVAEKKAEEAAAAAAAAEKDESGEKDISREDLLDLIAGIEPSWLVEHADGKSWKDINKMSDAELFDLADKYTRPESDSGGAEKEMSREEMLDLIDGIDPEWLVANGYDLSNEEIRELDDEKLRELLEAYSKPSEENPEDEPPTPEVALVDSPEYAEASRRVQVARANLAEASAKRRGFFGRKKGGAQEEAYNAARAEYDEATAALIKMQVDDYKNNNPDRKKILESLEEAKANGATPEEIAAIEKGLEGGVNKYFVELWSGENAKLINDSKERMDNGNVMRRIGAFMDRAPKWVKIGVGVAVSVGLGALMPAAGLAGAVAMAAGKAALFTRAGSRNSAINQNVNIFSQEQGEGPAIPSAEFIQQGVETPMERINALPKDQADSYLAVANWMTQQHTDGILKDKYDNRRRTIIATGSAAALTVGSHLLTGALANMLSNNEGAVSAGAGEGVATEGGGVDLGAVGGEGAADAAAGATAETAANIGEVANGISVREGGNWMELLREITGEDNLSFGAIKRQISPGTELSEYLRSSGLGYQMSQNHANLMGIPNGVTEISPEQASEILRIFTANRK